MGQLSDLGLAVDPRAAEPMYRQIFDQVVARVQSGTFPVGFRLPPTRALAEDLGTHRNTVVRAYEDLEAAGFVESTVGRGTFVAVSSTGSPVPRLSRAPVTGHRQSGVGAGAVAEDGGLPWTSLMARGLASEPLGRFERLQRSITMPASIDVINLSRMQPSADLLPDELFRRCIDHVLRTLGGKALAYAARDGLPRLRAAIAADLARLGVPASPEDLVVTSGSQQALDLVVRALVNPGDTFLTDESTYAGALNLMTAGGARLIAVPSDDEGPSLAALERLGRSGAGAKGLYLMPNSHNPTGAMISAARREALIAWSRRAGVPLIEDDFVADLNLDDAPRPPAMRALDGDVIYIGTFSKRLAPALRTGFLIVPPALRPKLIALKHAMDLGNSELLQHSLAEFLERGYLAAHLQKILPEYRRRREAIEGALARSMPKKIPWTRPEQGVSLWLPLPRALDPIAVFEEAQRKGVVVHPSSLNRVDENHHGGIRLTFSAEPAARLIEGAKRLGKVLTGMLDRTRGGTDDERQRVGGI